MDRHTYAARLHEAVASAAAASPVLSTLGEVASPDDMRILAKRHYAEVRTFIDLKLPSRMRLCSVGAADAKRFFAHVYAEEQGQFAPGKDHATLFETFCLAIGLGRDELEAEYQGYWPNFADLLVEEPGNGPMLRELAISFAWESMAPHLAGSLQRLLVSVRQVFDMSDEDIASLAEYFPLHVNLDEKHSNEALGALLCYVNDDSALEAACHAIRVSLVDKDPWSLPLHPRVEPV